MHNPQLSFIVGLRNLFPLFGLAFHARKIDPLRYMHIPKETHNLLWKQILPTIPEVATHDVHRLSLYFVVTFVVVNFGASS